MKIEAIFFDLTGVIYEFQGPKQIFELSNGKVDLNEFIRFWDECSGAIEFTRGTIGANEFASEAVNFFKLDCSTDDLIENYKNWFIGPFDGAFEIIEQLRKSYKVACLSNTNEIDVVRYRGPEALEKVFDMCFFSNEISFVKPEKEIYLHACEKMDLHPKSVLFLDDSGTCVRGALEAGLIAEQAVKPEGIRNALSKHGVLLN